MYLPVSASEGGPCNALRSKLKADDASPALCCCFAVALFTNPAAWHTMTVLDNVLYLLTDCTLSTCSDVQHNKQVPIWSCACTSYYATHWLLHHTIHGLCFIFTQATFGTHKVICWSGENLLRVHCSTFLPSDKLSTTRLAFDRRRSVLMTGVAAAAAGSIRAISGVRSLAARPHQQKISCSP